MPVIAADGTLRLFDIAPRATDAFPGTALLRIQLVATTSAPPTTGNPGEQNIVSESVYWLPKHADVFPMAGCFTGCKWLISVWVESNVEKVCDRAIST